MTAVHLNGTFYLCHAAWPVMRQQQFGRIVNTTSRAWITAEATPSYAASKAGVFGLMQSLASQGSVYGITANCISPEAYTRLVDWSRPLYDEFLRQGTIDQALYDTLDGIPPPDFVAPIVAYLGTDAAAGVTARVFEVRGNRVGLWQGPVEARMAFRESEPLEPWTVDELATVVPSLLNTV
jgi:NAD(P)-dependent dehydrogenase (short-subunit alcohol dehydrogenase family)